MDYCIKCGKSNPVSAKYCTGCGAALFLAPLTSNQPSIILQKKSNIQWIVIGVIVGIGFLIGAYFLFFKNAGQKGLATNESAGVTNEDATKLKELVHIWNTSLNKRNASEVTLLYSEQLVYYHNPMTKGNATKILSDFFLKNPNYHQEITSEITLEKINNTLLVCNFQKTVSQNGKTIDYPSYLKFSREGAGWKVVEEGDKITDYNIGKQQDAAEQQSILNKWIKLNIGPGIIIDSKTMKDAGFSATNYRELKTSLSDSYGDYFNVSGLQPEIKASKSWINLAFNGEEITINYFLGKEKVLRSYHLSAGSNGGSTSYDLITGQNKDFPFTITGIKDNLISMYHDGYGFDNNGEPTGHWWQSGTYDIITGNTSWGAKEH